MGRKGEAYEAEKNTFHGRRGIGFAAFRGFLDAVEAGAELRLGSGE